MRYYRREIVANRHADPTVVVTHFFKLKSFELNMQECFSEIVANLYVNHDRKLFISSAIHPRLHKPVVKLFNWLEDRYQREQLKHLEQDDFDRYIYGQERNT